jgi:hypothetical protein
MIHAQNAKKVLPIFQSSTTAAGTASGNIDTLGYDYLSLDVLLPTADVVSNKPTVLKLSESDDTVVTNFASVSGFVGGTDFTIPNAITAATSITQPYATLNVDLKGRKRYLKISVSPATTQVVNAVGQLTRAEQTPSTSSQATVVVNG